MRVAFLGYGKAGHRCLRSLIDHGIEITAVVPRSSDSGDDSDLFSVRRLAESSGITTLDHMTALEPPNEKFLEGIDYLVSVQFDRILDGKWLRLPQKDSLNLHFSYLPRLRGCYPTKWAIIKEDWTGVTLHSIDEGIDTGDILDQVKVKICGKETDQTLYHKLTNASIKLFEKNIYCMLENSFPHKTKQDDSIASYHPKEIPYDGILDLKMDLDFCERFLRAFTFPPFDPAQCLLHGQKVGLYPPRHKEKSRDTTPGRIQLTEDNLCGVDCLDGTMFFDRVLIEGESKDANTFYHTGTLAHK